MTIYNEPGMHYGEPGVTYLGNGEIRSSTRPIYWVGRGGKPEQKRKPFTSLAIASKCLSINGYDVELDSERSIRFAGEEEETEVKARFRGPVQTPEALYQVESSRVSGEEVPESPEGSFLIGDMEGVEEFDVSGNPQDKEESEIFIESKIIVKDNHYTLSCRPLTKTLDNMIITMSVQNDRVNKDPKDAS